MQDIIMENMLKKEKYLSRFACQSKDAIYLKKTANDIRPAFFHDADKILYSLSYIRYMDKTQVFRQGNNDHIQKRMLHVQYVSKIARTIGRALNLNEDLIEAAALGHDVGHCPFGHVGESILNKISLSLNQGYFEHNVNSVRHLMEVENYGKGQNISVQTLDAIFCHNGEILNEKYEPNTSKSIDDFLKEYNSAYQDESVSKKARPMTLEACVVRVSDIIAYIGRDIDDAKRMGLVTFKDVPENITKMLGSDNSQIVKTIIMDIIENSIDKPYIKMSHEVYKAINDLKDFNYKYIYAKSISAADKKILENKFNKLIQKYLNDLETNNQKSPIFSSFLNNMDNLYKNSWSNERIVIDYVSGMTDDYFEKEYQKYCSKS